MEVYRNKDEKDDSLIPFLNDPQSQEEVEAESPLRKVKKAYRDYELVETFECKQDSEEFLSNERCWGTKKHVSTEEGRKKILRCNLVKSRGQQCDARAYLLYESTSFRVLFFRSKTDHNCETLPLSSQTGQKMTDEVKKVIEDLYDQKKKPLAIADYLKVNKLPEPKIYQISNHIATYKKLKYGPSPLKLSELRALLEKYKDVPDSMDSPIALHDISSDNQTFRFFFTSKALLQSARGVISWSIDATAKMLWQGFPVLLVGTTDMDRKFHIIGVAVCSNENQADFAFLFQSVNECAMKIFRETYSPSVLVCDGAKAIKNAFQQVFGKETTIIMCWAHMFKNVSKRLCTLIKCKEIRAKILADITFLQTISNVAKFETARSLFLTKWSMEIEFIEYFTEEWINQNPNWYEGVKACVPSTNKALEATNRELKNDVTGRERLSVGEFIFVLTEIIVRYSKRCTTDLTFSVEPSISKETWYTGYKWAKQQHPLVKIHLSNGDISVAVKSSSYTTEDNHLLQTEWQSLDDFKKYYNSIWYVILSSTETSWMKSSCSCPFFQKDFMCKHVVGIAKRMGNVTIPEDVKNFQIAEKRKRGRPAKTKAAYIS